MFSTVSENTEIISCFTLYRDFIDTAFQNHSGHTLKSVFKCAIIVLNRREVMME
jgi:hypothetical protein